MQGPRLTVDAQRVDGVDKLLVHLHGPHDPRLLRTVALAVAVLTALPLCSISDKASAPAGCLLYVCVGLRQMDGLKVAAAA